MSSQLAFFDGQTFEAKHDRDRLETLLARVFDYMRSGEWKTLPEIVAACGGTEASVSARLRDFRKQRFGGHGVSRRPRGDRGRGMFEYRLQVARKG